MLGYDRDDLHTAAAVVGVFVLTAALGVLAAVSIVSTIRLCRLIL